MALAIMLYLFAARAVIFQSDPDNAQIDIDGLSFNIGDNYLLLTGDYKITASAPGYYPLTQTISVSDQATRISNCNCSPCPAISMSAPISVT